MPAQSCAGRGTFRNTPVTNASDSNLCRAASSRARPVFSSSWWPDRCSGDLDRQLWSARHRSNGGPRRLDVDQRIGGAEDSNGFCELLDFGCIHAHERGRLRPAAGTMLVAIDSMAISARLKRTGLPVERILLMPPHHRLRCGVRARVLLRIRVSAPVRAAHRPRICRSVADALAGLYFVLNTFAIAVAIALHERADPFGIWRADFQNLWLTFLGRALRRIRRVCAQGGSYAVFVFSAPLLLALILHFAYRNSTGRLADQLHHLAEVNRLHLSTIEGWHMLSMPRMRSRTGTSAASRAWPSRSPRAWVLTTSRSATRNRGRSDCCTISASSPCRSTFSTSRAS